jgi:putative membrane protein
VKLLPGLHFQGTAVQLAVVALVFGVLNAFLKPILTVLTCPFILLTLGLFALVVNG